jgi:hypothetical protein
MPIAATPGLDVGEPFAAAVAGVRAALSVGAAALSTKRGGLSALVANLGTAASP